MGALFNEWAEQFKRGMADADRAPALPCPCCGQQMLKEIGMGRISGYICLGVGCQFHSRRIAIESIVDADEWQLIQEEARITKETFEAMRLRNGAHARDRNEGLFEAIRTSFCKQHGISTATLSKRLAADQDDQFNLEWRAFLSNNMDCYCSDCHGYHKPTAEHPACRFCRPGFVHAPMPLDIYFHHRGWKFTPPFICMGCGIEVCYRQWAFSRSCGSCDVSGSRTRRAPFGRCFAGPHERLESWNEKDHDIPEDHFIAPKDTDNYSVILRPKGTRS